MDGNTRMKSTLTIATFVLLGAGAAFTSGCRKEAPAHVDPIPAHETFNIASTILGETRVICVWAPPGYADTDAVYPVLYMPDGGIKEDFPHIAGTIADLVARGEIAPVIVVGIENTVRRRDLTGPTTVPRDAEIAPVNGGSAAFRAFIGDELFPEIGRRYRVDGRRAIVGESLAGLFVVESLLLAPGMFDVHIAMDPSLWWNDHELVRRAPDLLAAFPARPLTLWFAGSDAGDISVNTGELAAILGRGAPEGLAWTYSPQPAEHHDTIFRATKEAAFRRTLWKPAGE